MYRLPGSVWVGFDGGRDIFVLQELDVIFELRLLYSSKSWASGILRLVSASHHDAVADSCWFFSCSQRPEISLYFLESYFLRSDWNDWIFCLVESFDFWCLRRIYPCWVHDLHTSMPQKLLNPSFFLIFVVKSWHFYYLMMTFSSPFQAFWSDTVIVMKRT